MWRQDIDSLVKTHQDGCERMCVITLDVQPIPLCIVSVYIPCTGSREYENKYEQCIDEIGEIIMKFVGYTIIILGDMNASDS